MPEGSNALSVSAALSIAKGKLEEITVRVVGEVSEFSSNARYKAVYFTIKDERASLPCMMWANRYSSCGVELQVGALVELTGRFSLYAAKGRMNFDVFSVELAGEGKLRMQVANIVRRLDSEGLLSASRKKQIPRFPERIGLVTSPRGAAVYDVLRTLRRRFPLAEVVFAGVGVEGEGAPAGIIEGLDAVQDAGVELILLVRGGGSFEDLMPFNDEGLARHIASMEVPVITGIGHEPDTSIADLVSDFRASTPTAAAEAVTPSFIELVSTLSDRGRRAHGVISGRLSSTGRILDRYSLLPLFQDPMSLLHEEAQEVDDLSKRLHASIPGGLSSAKDKLRDIRGVLASGLYALMIKPTASLNGSKAALQSAGRSLPVPFAAQLSSHAASLEALSPLAVLSRGYSVTRGPDGRIMSSISHARVGEKVSVQVSDGNMECTVDSIEEISLDLEVLDAS